MSVTVYKSTGCDSAEDWNLYLHYRDNLRSRKQAVTPLPVCFISFITLSYVFSISGSGKMFVPFLHSVQTGPGSYLLTYLLHEAEPFLKS